MTKKVQLARQTLLDWRLADIAETWFPEAWRRGQFERELLYDISESEQSDKKSDPLGFRWEGKDTAVEALGAAPAGALIPNHELSYKYKNARHAYIIGDSLESLKLLHPAYFGKFRMAYVDPPYNTGSDFVYVDDIEDPIGNYSSYLDGSREDAAERSLGHHSAWLSMMLPRLFAVRNLLRDDGVVFVVIDDHESHRLRLLMDELFGEENFVCNFIWEKRYSPAPDAPDVGYVHENVLCYRKSDQFLASLLPMSEDQRARYKNPDNDPRGDWKPADYTCRYTSVERPNLYYSVKNPHSGEDIWPKKTRVWACSEKGHKKNVAEKLVWWPKGASVPAKKRFVNEIAQGQKPKSILTRQEVGTSHKARKELQEFAKNFKATPKPSQLIKRLMEIAGVTGGDLVLDVFARVGSVGYTIAGIDDIKDRPRLVSIEFPEKVEDPEFDSLANVGLQRFIKSLKDRSGSGCRVFRLEESGIHAWRLKSDTNLEELTRQVDLASSPIDPGRTRNEILAEIALESGCELTQIPTADEGQQPIFEIESADVAVYVGSSISEDLLNKLLSSDMTRLIVIDDAFGSDESLRQISIRLADEKNKIIRFI